MPRYTDDDPSLEPGSRVLKNRFGIEDAAILEQIEAAFVATRSYELSQTPLKGWFDLAHLQIIHRYLFGDVYEWAGQVGAIDTSKGADQVADSAHVRNAATQIFQQLAKESRLAGLDAPAFGDRAAYYLGALGALHPFREGNGVALRAFISHLAHANGYYIAWENMSQADMLAAAMGSFNGDTSKLAALIRQNVTSPDPDG